MNESKKKRVILGMSGGVDSSVALCLLKEQGFEVVGLTLKFAFWHDKNNKLKENICSFKENVERAKKVCKKYGVPHFVVDSSKEFQKTVIDYFIKTLKGNKTPSPCSFCNREVKIKALLDFAKKKKADYAATGHYARIKKANGVYQLLRAQDRDKDQSYFLSLLNQKQLAKLIFPLGDYTKNQVYKIARKEEIDFAPKQSQDLCFVDDKSLPAFLEKEAGLFSGKIRDAKGNFLGEHKGLHFYTIGQRKGIKLAGGPFWVIGFDKKKNILIVSDNPKDSKLFAKEAILSGVSFISGKAPAKNIRVMAKVRYRQPLSKGTLSAGKSAGSSGPKIWNLVFDKPQRAVTPGQTAVFYESIGRLGKTEVEVCLGGGIIEMAK